jgi:hypothetical protein
MKAAQWPAVCNLFRYDKPDNDRFKMFFGRSSQGQLVPVRIEVKSWIGMIIGRLDMGKIEMK